MKIGWNGSVVNADEAVISVYDHGFLYGLGLFETFRTYQGKPYLLDRHLRRLQAGCNDLGIPFHMVESELLDWLQQLFAANQLEDGYVRLTVSAGAGELGLPTGDYERSNALVLVKSLPPSSATIDRHGKELRLLQTKRNTPEGSIRYKSLHYMNNILAKRELLSIYDSGSAGVEGLMQSESGWLAEGIVSNLFFVSEGVVRTPAIATGILPGITRERVLELANISGIATEEGYYSWEYLLQADEVWMTNSIQELVPITKLTDTAGHSVIVGQGQAGEITTQLLQAYHSDTMKD